MHHWWEQVLAFMHDSFSMRHASEHPQGGHCDYWDAITRCVVMCHFGHGTAFSSLWHKLPAIPCIEYMFYGQDLLPTFLSVGMS